jgi:hypothetical protein
MLLMAHYYPMARPEKDPNPLEETDDVPRVDPTDLFSPPQEPCECYCLHCGRTFSSDGIWLQRYRQPPRDSKGFWMCPTPNCDGRGFTLDIFPTDPHHPCNANGLYDDDDEEFADDLGACEREALREELLAEGLSIDEDPIDQDDLFPEDPADYDPDEPQYKAMDEGIGLDDTEGEEWKHGLLPGDYPLDFMAEDDFPPRDLRDDPHDDPRFDQPDRRPREIDYTEPDPRCSEDDLPF